jgi:hypothetical protein
MEIAPMSNLPRPSITAVAHDLPGHSVVLADGEELGVVADVIETAVSDGAPAHALVVEVDAGTTDEPADPLLIAADGVLTVTDDAVVLGTTAAWLGQHTVTSGDDG